MAKLLLALDIATTTGWALGALDDVPKADAIRFAKKDALPDEVWLSGMRWLHDLLKVAQPDVVALEAPIMSSSPAGGSNPHTQLLLTGLQAVLRTVVAANLPRPAKLVHVQSARKFFIGHGNKPGAEAKHLVKRRCIELGWLDPDAAGFDRSDALCVWAKAAGDLSPVFAANLTPLMTAGQKPALQPEPEF